MDAPRSCPDCGGKMTPGFIPDATYGQVLQTHWYAGEPEDATFLGIKTGLKVDREHMYPIWAFRCTSCGRLTFYADVE